jgi:hypothetical protein
LIVTAKSYLDKNHLPMTNSFKHIIVLAFLCAIFSVASTPAHSDDRTYNETIVLPADAGAGLKAAAADAAQTLQKMTGKEFQVVPEYSRPGIWLLRSSDPQVPGDAARQLKTKGREPFVIRSAANRLLIIANADDGLQHGLYFYLDQLGARWFLPNENWTVIPQRADVRLTLDRLVEPAFKSRQFFGTGGFGRARMNRMYDLQDKVPAQWEAWKRRNRFGGEFAIRGHAGENFNLVHKAELLAHPEYLAEIDGKRQPWSLTVKPDIGNPDFVKLYVADRLASYRDLRTRLPGTAESFAVSVEPADGGGDCNTGPCTQIGNGSPSDQVFYLANQVAKAIKQEYPDGRASLYAYNTHAAVPSIDIDPNVFVMLVPYAFLRVGLTPEEFIEAWSRKVPEMGLYDYWSIPDWGHDMPDFDYLHRPAQSIRFWHDHHVIGLFGESSYSAGAVGIPWYLASRLMWDPQADEKAILADFYSKAFGPAAPPMKRMLERWSSGFMLGAMELGSSYRDLNEARRLAAGDAAVMARLNDYGRYLHYIRLWYEYLSHPSAATDTAPNPYTLALVNYMWNIYDSAMIEPFRMTQLVSFNRFDRAGKDSVTVGDWYKDGWKNIHQITDEEISKLIDEGSKKYPPVDLERRVFSGELVPALPVQDKDAPARPPVVMTYSSAIRFEMLVPPGMKSLPLQINSGWPLPIKLCDANEKVLWEYTLPAGSQAPGPDVWEKHLTQVDVPLPGPGHYSLVVWNEKKMFRLQSPIGLKFTMSRFLNSQGRPAPRLYFYVPTGTKTVAFTLAYFLVPKVYDSTGREGTPEIKIPGIYEVAVPPGEDGKIWSMTDVKTPAAMTMINVPQYFAFSPEALLVPESALKNQ